MRGNKVELDGRAEATAEYLYEVQWGPKTLTEEENETRKRILEEMNNTMDDSDVELGDEITVEEVK